MNDYPSRTSPTTATRCAAPGCRLNPESPTALAAALLDPTAPPPARPTVTGTDLCAWHHAHFPKVLADLVSLWPVLEGALYRKTAAGEENQRVQTSNVLDLAQSWNPHVSEVMAELADWTGFVVRTVFYERPLPFPTVQEDEDGFRISIHSRGLTLHTKTRDALAALALHDAHWLSSYPLLGPSLLVDAQDLRLTAIRAIDSQPVKRVGISGAICGHVVDDAGFGPVSCMSTMVAILSEDVHARPSVIVCSTHPKSHRQFTRDEWMRL
jgi:hypothetical protein